MNHRDHPLLGPTVDLLQALIRNRCVNDGTPDSGQEHRSADLLASYLEHAAPEVACFEPLPGRRSVVARLAGTDPAAPSLCLMGHTDVVPVSPESWSRDPFGGELVDGEVWGRGALDMLGVTASMAVAFKHLADTGLRPHGDLVFFGVADEEAGSALGAEWMIEHHWDKVGADYVLTEFGGYQMPDAATPRIVITAAEKGLAWRRLIVHGTPAHGSMPFRTDNALVTAAAVVQRLAAYHPPAKISDVWAAYVAALPIDDTLRTRLLDPHHVLDALDALPPQNARFGHACTHTTISPNQMRAGEKTNTIPDRVEIDVDIRALPGDTPDEVDRYLTEALGELNDRVEIEILLASTPNASPLDTDLWHILRTQVQAHYPAADLVPALEVGGTDARFYRARGTVAYGAALLSPDLTMEQFNQRFHGNDERIDVASLALTTELWTSTTRALLTP